MKKIEFIAMPILEEQGGGLKSLHTSPVQVVIETLRVHNTKAPADEEKNLPPVRSYRFCWGLNPVSYIDKISFSSFQLLGSL